MNRLFLTIFLSVMALSSFSQKIRGWVMAENNQPVSGTNIVIMGTPSGTVAGVTGKFELSPPPGECSLYFAFVGWKAVEKKFFLHRIRFMKFGQR